MSEPTGTLEIKIKFGFDVSGRKQWGSRPPRTRSVPAFEVQAPASSILTGSDPEVDEDAGAGGLGHEQREVAPAAEVELALDGLVEVPEDVHCATTEEVGSTDGRGAV